jgi:hypothetical protein
LYTSPFTTDYTDTLGNTTTIQVAYDKHYNMYYNVDHLDDVAAGWQYRINSGSRGSGRTLRMIKAMPDEKLLAPDEPIYLFARTYQISMYIRETIRHFRGDSYAKRIRLYSVANIDHVINLNHDDHVFLDHTCFENIQDWSVISGSNYRTLIQAAKRYPQNRKHKCHHYNVSLVHDFFEGEKLFRRFWVPENNCYEYEYVERRKVKITKRVCETCDEQLPDIEKDKQDAVSK